MKIEDVAMGKTRTPEQWELFEKELARLKEENKRLRAYHQNIIDAVTNSVGRLPEINAPKIVRQKSKYPEETAILDLSDFQLGSLVNQQYTAGLCQYDKNIFRARARRLIKSVHEIIEIQRAMIPIRKLKIHILGDIVQGEDVFPGQGFQLDALLMEQVFGLGDEVIGLILQPLAELFESVEIFCVAGNHGKQGRPGSAARMTNWDYITYWLWKNRMAETKHVKFYVSASPFLIYELYPGQNHGLIHGNQARGWLGYPYYGVDRMHRKMQTLTGIIIHYLHHGHHHQPHIGDMHIGQILANGSFEGGSDYSVGDLLTANIPKQLFFGINSKGMTWEYQIRLSDYPKLKPNEQGIFTTLMFNEGE